MDASRGKDLGGIFLALAAWTSSSPQLIGSIATLTDGSVAEKLALTYDIEGGQGRTFPLLASAREGSLIGDSVWATSDHLAQDVAKCVADEVARLSTCGAVTKLARTISSLISPGAPIGAR